MTNTEAFELIVRGVVALRQSAEQGTVDSLGHLGDARGLVAATIDQVAVELHDTWLIPWTVIGVELGVSKQAVQQRYASRMVTEEF